MPETTNRPARVCSCQKNTRRLRGVVVVETALISLCCTVFRNSPKLVSPAAQSIYCFAFVCCLLGISMLYLWCQ